MPDGAPVGSYQPNDAYLKPRPMDVTSEKFDGFAVDRYITRIVPKTPAIYPACTLNGR